MVEIRNFNNKNPSQEDLKSGSKKTRHIQKLAISKKSTFFVQSSWKFVKMIISKGNYFHQVS